MDDEKAKIQIRPKGTVIPKVSAGTIHKDMDDIKQEVKRLKKHMGRLLNIAEHEESVVEQYKDKEMTLVLVDGTKEQGTLKEITKFQIVIEIDKVKQHFYKSSVVKYHF